MGGGIVGGLFICEVLKSVSYRECSSIRDLQSISCFLLWLKVYVDVSKVQWC